MTDEQYATVLRSTTLIEYRTTQLEKQLEAVKDDLDKLAERAGSFWVDKVLAPLLTATATATIVYYVLHIH